MKPTNKQKALHSRAETLPDDLAAVFAQAPQGSESEIRQLKEAAAALDRDPKFVADYLKGLVVEDLLRALEEVAISKNALADRVGKTRQYVSRILDEDARVNFTIDTLAELAVALERELIVRVVPKNDRILVIRRIRMEIEPAESFNRTSAQSPLMSEPFKPVLAHRFNLEAKLEPASLPA